MSQPSLIRLLRSRWQEIARSFWPQTPRRRLESALARLDDELARRQSRLLLLRKRIEKIHNFLNRREHRLELLAARMHEAAADAGEVAEFERWRLAVDRLRERLQKCERGYALRLTHLRQRKQHRAELRERLLSGSLAEPADDESDPDYPF